MKRAILLCVLAVLFVLSTAAHGEEATTLTGEFVWSHRSTTGALEAIFTPKGDGKWDVVFHFEFRGKPHVYTGTAEGSLTDGTLSGTVLNENQRRTFAFSGDVQEGRFSGRHSEVENGREKSTGTLTLGG